MKRTPRAAAWIAAALLCAATAHAEEPSPRVLWWVEGRPWSCSGLVGPVARQVELACDASRQRCGIATNRSAASRIASLACAPEGAGFRLDAEDPAGHPLWSVALAGDEETRARKAAMWIARADTDGPLLDAIPPPAAASPATPPPSAAKPADAMAPAVVVVLPPPPAKDEVSLPSPQRGPREPHLRPVLDVSMLAATPLSTLSAPEVPMTGARFVVALPIGSGFSVGGAGDGMTRPDKQADVYAHLGAFAGFGAPYTHDWFGVSGEAGVALRIATTGRPDGPVPYPYGKVTATAQWPRREGVRPYLSASYLASTDPMNRSLFANLGVAWDLR